MSASPQCRTGGSFLDALVGQCRELDPLRVAVVFAVDELAIRGAFDAWRAGIAVPTLIGPIRRAEMAARRAGLHLGEVPIVDAPDERAAVAIGVEAVHRGEADLLMKGSLPTSMFLHGAFDRAAGLLGPGRASHVFACDVPGYDRPLFVTDAAVNVSPSLAHKADICRNAIDLTRMLGIDRPKVAVLAAIETVEPVMPCTVDAAALQAMADRGEIEGGVVAGPLALDDAISRRAARSKHLASTVAGDADVLLAPDVESGNILYKSLVHLAKAEAAGIVVGARVPLVVTGRADATRARVASVAMAALWARHLSARAVVPGRAGGQGW